MATFVKTGAGTWKAVIRKQGWPITFKTFRTKRDATDWARSAEDEMVRGVYISLVDMLAHAHNVVRQLAKPNGPT